MSETPHRDQAEPAYTPRPRIARHRIDRRHDATYARIREELEARELARRERERLRRTGPAANDDDETE
jgi:hypothetical protein